MTELMGIREQVCSGGRIIKSETELINTSCILSQRGTVRWSTRVYHLGDKKKKKWSRKVKNIRYEMLGVWETGQVRWGGGGGLRGGWWQ